MIIIATGEVSSRVSIDAVILSGSVYSHGLTGDECKNNASDILKDILSLYSTYYNNVVCYSLSMKEVRCVDGNGTMTVEYLCSIEVHASGAELCDSILAFEKVARGMEDDFLFSGWQTFVSAGKKKEVVSDIIKRALREAKFEAECASPTKNYKVQNVIVHNLDEGEDSQLVVLPDTTSGDREVLFINLGSTIKSECKYVRRVEVTISV